MEHRVDVVPATDAERDGLARDHEDADGVRLDANQICIQGPSGIPTAHAHSEQRTTPTGCGAGSGTMETWPC
ncbi:MAG: hypothetical protein JWM61_2268 [Micrococcaceae bacterium]|jgi:hypothetical protein|nr:hypothetical protein [Micrococcaceae bacterium]